VQEDVDKFHDGRNKIMLGDEPGGSDSEEDEDDVDVVRVCASNACQERNVCPCSLCVPYAYA
jgi:hypothetical protein